jgi:hypothetical protein
VTPAPVIVTQPALIQPPGTPSPGIQAADGRREFIEGARNVLIALKSAPTVELPKGERNIVDTIPPNLWPVSDYLLTISRDLTVLPSANKLINSN